jgi:hypothetical protein
MHAKLGGVVCASRFFVMMGRLVVFLAIAAGLLALFLREDAYRSREVLFAEGVVVVFSLMKIVGLIRAHDRMIRDRDQPPAARTIR